MFRPSMFFQGYIYNEISSGILISVLYIWTNGIFVRVIEHLVDIRLKRKKGEVDGTD